jgi:hypothetical protein
VQLWALPACVLLRRRQTLLRRRRRCWLRDARRLLAR